MPEFDDRLVRVSIQIGDALKIYESPLAITATGMKYANPLQDEADITVFNMSQSDRDYILTETSPYNKNPKPKLVILEAGRVSTGLAKVFEGDISTSDVTQPPDIGLKLRAQAHQYLKGKLVSAQQAGSVPLSRIAKAVANDLGVGLNFQATEKNIANYAYTGAALKQVDKLSSLGAVSAYLDGNQLVVKDMHLPLSGVLRIVSDTSGLVGIPQLTEQGVQCTCMLDNSTKLGGGLQVVSKLNPATNGTYVIYKLGFNIASRATPFYWIPEGLRRSNDGGVEIPADIQTKNGTKRR